jgi:ParB family transcriptional regulator, chromosome partitioning protein
VNRPRGLGRGLGALFPGAPAPQRAAPGVSIMELPLDRVRPNPHQPRRRFDEEALAALAQSIRAHGLLAPIMVRALEGEAEAYEIIAGERRWRAAQLAGLASIAAIVRETRGGEAIELAMLENLQRTDLNPIEEAAGYRQLLEEHDYTQEMLAQRIGKSRSAVANTLRLLALPDAVQALVRDGRLSAGHARALVTLPHGRAKELAQEAVRLGLSVRDVERKSTTRPARSGRAAPSQTSAPHELSPELADVENRLRFALATRVSLRPRAAGGGTVEIQYADDGELTRILERIAPLER